MTDGFGEVMAQYALTKVIPFAPCNGFPSHPSCGEAEASNTFK